MRVSEYKGCSYVSLAQVAALFDGHLHWRPMAKQVDLKLRGHRIRFPYGARTAYVNGRRCSLEGPTIRNEQGFWVPASFFATPAFCRATQTKLEWPSQRPLPPGRPSEAVKKIVSSPRQVVGRGPASTENGWGPAYSLPGRRIFHTFSVAGARGEGASATASKSPPAAEPALSAKAIRRIVIDPGHGGKDPGTVSARGVEEKEINLSMAQELADVLREQGGYEVLMTRTDDTFVPLEDRAQLANRYHADLFISLHCNASLSSKLKGFEVYFLSEKASDPHADAVARFENASLALEGKTPSPRQVETVLRSLVKTAYINESSSLGSLIDREVAQRLSEPSLGVKQAAFYVLRGAEMPAVLVEAGFLSNAKEARLLQKDSFRRRLIGAVAAGIQAYDVRKRQERR